MMHAFQLVDQVLPCLLVFSFGPCFEFRELGLSLLQFGADFVSICLSLCVHGFPLSESGILYSICLYAACRRMCPPACPTTSSTGLVLFSSASTIIAVI